MGRPKRPQTNHPTPVRMKVSMLVLLTECVFKPILERCSKTAQGCIHTPCPAGGVVEASQAHGGGVDDVGGSGGVCSGSAATAAARGGRRAAVITTTTGAIGFRYQRHCLRLPRLFCAGCEGWVLVLKVEVEVSGRLRGDRRVSG